MRIDGFDNGQGGVVKVHRDQDSNALIISGDDPANGNSNPVLLTICEDDAQEFAELVQTVAKDIAFFIELSQE